MKGTLIGLGVLGVLTLAVVLIVSGGTQVPDGPVPIAWDHEPCAHCHMQIGEPRHAAQLITSEGRVFNFDDVGCAVSYLRARSPSVHRLWFHGEGETWLGVDVVGFTKTGVTPMGSGLQAVDRRQADASPWEQVLREHQQPASPPPPSRPSPERAP